jgi:hypothetical protein
MRLEDCAVRRCVPGECTHEFSAQFGTGPIASTVGGDEDRRERGGRQGGQAAGEIALKALGIAGNGLGAINVCFIQIEENGVRHAIILCVGHEPGTSR